MVYSHRQTINLFSQHEELSDASSMLTTSKEVGKAVSLAIYNVLCIVIVGDVSINSSNVAGLISTSHAIMAISAVLTLSAAILLFYSKFHDD